MHFRYIKKIKICILFLIGISHSKSINYFPGFVTIAGQRCVEFFYLLKYILSVFQKVY